MRKRRANFATELQKNPLSSSRGTGCLPTRQLGRAPAAASERRAHRPHPALAPRRSVGAEGKVRQENAAPEGVPALAGGRDRAVLQTRGGIAGALKSRLAYQAWRNVLGPDTSTPLVGAPACSGGNSGVFQMQTMPLMLAAAR
jgi:hypothetical protein